MPVTIETLANTRLYNGDAIYFGSDLATAGAYAKISRDGTEPRLDIALPTDGLYLDSVDDTVGGKSVIAISSTFTAIGATAHKAIKSELTYSPAATGTACPIAVVGKVTLDGNCTGNAASSNYPGMGWGIQGQVHIATGSTIDSGGFGDPGAIYAGVRGVLTDAGTSTYTKGILTAFFGDIQITQNASANANFEVYGAYLYLYQAVSNTQVDAMLCVDKHASVNSTSIEKGIYLKCGMSVGIDIDPAAGTIVTGIDIGTVTTGISFTGTITGNGIDFSNITMVPSGSGGTALIRAGSYTDDAESSFVQNSSNNQGGLIRLYGATSGTSTSQYDRGIFVCLVTTGTKGIMPIAGLAEVRNHATGPDKVRAAEFVCDLHTTGAKLAAPATGISGMFAVWAKITAIDGATCSASARAAAIWLDNQLYGANASAIGEEFTIWSTTGGSVPTAWAGFRTSGAGWDQLFYFDDTCYNIAPISNTSLKVLLNTTQHYIPLSTADGSFTTAYPINLTYAGAAFSIASTMSAAITIATITVTDSSTVSSGRGIGLFIDYVMTGTKTGTYGVRSSRINTNIGADVDSVIIADWYMHTIADRTINWLMGLSSYWEDYGDGVANLAMIDLGINSPHAITGTDRHAFIRCREHDTVQAISSVLTLEGDNAAAFVFDFHAQADSGNGCLVTDTDDGNVSYGIKVRLHAHGDVVKYIHLHD